MSLESELDAAATRMVDYMAQVRASSITSLCGKIIDDTPVLTGALKGSWRSSLGTPSDDSSPRPDDSGEIPKAEAQAVISAAPASDLDFYFTNNMPYSEMIEYDGVSHTKAPEGMVRKNLPAFPGLVAQFSSSREP